MINLTTVFQVPMTHEAVQYSARKTLSFADAYREDPDFRSLADADPATALAKHDVEVRPDTEVSIVEDSDEVFHFVFPPDWNVGVGDEVLNSVAGGGKCASCACDGPGYGGPRGPSCGCGAGCIDSWTFGRD